MCLIHPSACHDEIVVYRITHGSARDSLALDGRKIVNGQEVEMGVLGCRVAQPGAQVICVIPSGVWRFTVNGDSLVGELRLSDNTKSRDVRATRSRLLPRVRTRSAPRQPYRTVGAGEGR